MPEPHLAHRGDTMALRLQAGGTDKVLKGRHARAAHAIDVQVGCKSNPPGELQQACKVPVKKYLK